MIEIEGPDGVVNEFPDGTPDDVIKRTMAKQYGAPAKAAAPARPSQADVRRVDNAPVSDEPQLSTFEQAQGKRAQLEEDLKTARNERTAALRSLPMRDMAARAAGVKPFDEKIAGLEAELAKTGVSDFGRTAGSMAG